MAMIIQLKPIKHYDPVNDLNDEWNRHKKNLTFQRFISERMPLFFGPLSSNLSLFDKIKFAERQLGVKFSLNKQDNSWTGQLLMDGEYYQCPRFALEDDIRLFIILLHLKITVLQN